MLTVDSIAHFLDRLAPAGLAEEWDNVGLLLGDRHRSVQRVMTCLTITPDSAAEAMEEHADLVVTHHPLPFRAIRRFTTDTPDGQLLWGLAGARVSIYSAHTAFDSARDGINQQWAEMLGLLDVEPLVDKPLDNARLGSGRCGRLAQPAAVRAVAGKVKKALGIQHVQLVGSADSIVTHVAVACGSAGEFLDIAVQRGCGLFITGETRFHTCLAAEASGISLLLAGHYASERFGMERLAAVLSEAFPSAHVWASLRERDPLQWM